MRLRLLNREEYHFVKKEDPFPYYFWPFFGALFRKRIEMCLAECTGGERVLEIGFGSGISFLNLGELYDEIHGIDSTAVITETQTLFRSKGINLFLQRGTVSDIKYPDQSFDSIVLVSVLEHLKPVELEGAFLEMDRVLKPGGQIIYGVPYHRLLMSIAFFSLLGYSIRRHHHSTEKDIFNIAKNKFFLKSRKNIYSISRLLGPVYNVCDFIKLGL